MEQAATMSVLRAEYRDLEVSLGDRLTGEINGFSQFFRELC